MIEHQLVRRCQPFAGSAAGTTRTAGDHEEKSCATPGTTMPSALVAATRSPIAKAFAVEDAGRDVVDAALTGTGLLRTGDVQVVLTPTAGRELIEGGGELRITREPLLELVGLLLLRSVGVTGSDLHRRVPEPDREDEIGRLARTLYQMLERLENASGRQRQFVADAAHEPRTRASAPP